MTLRDNWNNVVNEFRNSSLNRWQSDNIESSRNNKYDITILLDTWIPPILRRLSGVFLHNIPKNCAREIKSKFTRQRSITLDQIIGILVEHNCKPKIKNGDKKYGYTHSRTDFNECMWHLYVLG
jgi:hypothetical protein